MFKKGHKPHNKGHVLRDANFAAPPKKHHDGLEVGWDLPEQGKQFDYPWAKSKNSVWKSSIDL